MRKMGYSNWIKWKCFLEEWAVTRYYYFTTVMCCSFLPLDLICFKRQNFPHFPHFPHFNSTWTWFFPLQYLMQLKLSAPQSGKVNHPNTLAGFFRHSFSFSFFFQGSMQSKGPAILCTFGPGTCLMLKTYTRTSGCLRDSAPDLPHNSINNNSSKSSKRGHHSLTTD